MHNRRSVVGIEIEPLEWRRMLSFSAAQYFPMGAGNTWTYTGTFDGQSVTSATTTSALATLPSGPVTRIDGTVTAGGTVDTTSAYFSLDSGGLKLHRIDGTTDGSEALLTFGIPLRVLNATFNTSDVINFGSVPTQVTLTDAQFGNVNGSGTTTGTSTVLGVERVNLPGGRFINAIKFTTDIDINLSGKVSGVTWNLTGSDTTTYWVGFGLGVVKQTENATLNFSAPAAGVNESSTTTANLTLSSSSLLPADAASLSGGVLTFNGTAGADVLSVTSTTGKIVATTGGVSEEFNTASVMHINVFGFDGNDVATVGAGVPGVYIDAGAGNDIVTGGAGPDTVTGGGGKDRVDGGTGDDRLAGNGGHDLLVGNLGADRLYGGSENDTMEGSGGVDRLWGGAGDDVLGGSGSNDKLYGEDGNDVLSGGTQNDLLQGGLGTDQIFGGDGNDVLSGGDGNDILNGGTGQDTAYGDAGADVLQLLDGLIDTADGGADLDIASADPNDLLSNL